MLAENGRLQKLNSIINSFKIIMAAHRGDLPCVVTTAKVQNMFWFLLGKIYVPPISIIYNINIKYSSLITKI